MKKKLIIVRNELNDKGSEAYIKQIKRQRNNNFSDEIDIMEFTIDHQEIFEDVLGDYPQAKVLLIEPTTLTFPIHLNNRNVEQDQTAHVVVNMIKGRFNTDTTKILLIGSRGNVGRVIFNELHFNHGYCVTPVCSTCQYSVEEISKYFDIVINTSSQNSDVEYFVDCCELYDVAGNFKYGHENIEVEIGNRMRYAKVESFVEEEHTVGEIGEISVNTMLQTVVK